MKDLAKTIVLVSIAALFAMTSTADAKNSRKHKSKSKKAAASKTVAAESVPWYELGIEDLKPAPTVKPRVVEVHQPATMSLGFERRRQHQARRTQAPSGQCKSGCDKTARQIHMSTLVLVKDAKAAKKAKSKKAKTKKRARSAKALKLALAVR